MFEKSFRLFTMIPPAWAVKTGLMQIMPCRPSAAWWTARISFLLHTWAGCCTTRCTSPTVRICPPEAFRAPWIPSAATKTAVQPLMMPLKQRWKSSKKRRIRIQTHSIGLLLLPTAILTRWTACMKTRQWICWIPILPILQRRQCRTARTRRLLSSASAAELFLRRKRRTRAFLHITRRMRKE